MEADLTHDPKPIARSLSSKALRLTRHSVRAKRALLIMSKFAAKVGRGFPPIVPRGFFRRIRRRWEPQALKIASWGSNVYVKSP